MTVVVKRIKLSDIISDIDLQSRASIDSATVEEYAQASDAGFPPIVVFEDPVSPSSYWPGDGWHRVMAAHKRGQIDIAAEIREGTRRDALLFSCGANATHGLHRTDADKRRAVQRLLDDAEWSTWSNVAIAKAAAVSAPFVLSIRKAMEERGEIRPTETRKGQDGRRYPAKPSVNNDKPKRDSVKRDSLPHKDAPPARKPVVAPMDADLPEQYQDHEGNDVPESLFPVWQRVDDYLRISNRIRESGVIEALTELREIGVELGCKETAVYADDAIQKVRQIAEGVKQRAPAFVRGEGWSSFFTEFMEAGGDE
jgi:hypothetical protein